MTAYTSLFATFTRWESEAYHPRNPQVFSPSIHKNLTTYARAYSLPPVPAALAFQEQLPTLAPSQIPAEKLDCPVCMRPYADFSVAGKEIDTSLESAAQLPCKHLIGSSCLYEWLSPFTYQHKNTCPLCRAVLFPPQITYEGDTSDFENKLDIEDWRTQMSGKKLTSEEHRHLLKGRAQLLRFRLQDARAELLDLDHESAKL